MRMIYTPLKMRPCYKEYPWGGTRLRTEFGKRDAPLVTAESWELSAHPDGITSIASQPFIGQSLLDLERQNRLAFWGSNCADEKFPLLVKLIDARDNLSVQVHPSDRTAIPELGEEGKTELWYIVDCKPRSYIYLGFARKLSKEQFLKRAKEGSICDLLNRVPVSPGDVFYIISGTIHAIGAGIVIAEIQRNSNTTFRIFDYHRKGNDGKERTLHLERAAAVLNYEPLLPESCRANNQIIFPEFQLSEMFSCRWFRSYCVDVRQEVRLHCDGFSFQHLLCVDGNGEILTEHGAWPIRKGDSWFLPAAMGIFCLRGRCRCLLSRI